MRKIDYDKVAVEYSKKYNMLYAGNYLSRIDRGVIACTNIRENIKKIAYRAGKPIERFLVIDYKHLTKIVFEETGEIRSPAYIKQVHLGAYSSSRIKAIIEKALQGE